MGSKYEEMEEEKDAKEFSFFGMWVKPERDDLVVNFKEALDATRDAKLEKEQREIAAKGEKVLGINWLGVEAFLKEAGMLKCKHPMGWVITNVVKPICDNHKCELIELFFGVMYDDCPVVGEANWFFSYTWAEPFQSTVQTLRSNLFSKSAEEDPLADRFYWWDMFCQNQHIVKDVQGTFDTAITQVSNLAVSIPNPAAPNAVTRIWCLFEIMSAVENSKPVTIYVNLSDHSAAQANVPEINVQEAQATVESDKEMILKLIDSRIKGGVEALNTAVFKALRDGLVQALVVRSALSASKGSVRLNDEYKYLSFTELKKLLLKSDKSDKAVVKSMIQRQELIEYSKEAGIPLPSEEKVKELKAKAREEQEKHNKQFEKMERVRMGKARAVQRANWI